MSRHFSGSFLVLLAGLFALPFLAIALSAVATDWSDALLPRHIGLDVITSVLGDPRFQASVLRSLAISFAALALSLALIVPAIVAAHVYWPALDRWFARLVMLPYAVPAVVLVVGYLRVFSQPPVQINGTPILLALAYVPLCFPMLYVNVKNALQGLAVRDWLDAGRLVGATDERVLLCVVLPMIAPAIGLACVLNLGILMGEFVYANLLVGGRFETLQIYMFAQRSESGSVTSVIILAYFLTLLLLTALAIWLSARGGTDKR